MSEDPANRAAQWLERTYGGLVTLTDDQPLLDGDRTQLFGCDYVGGSAEPLLAATIAVPKDGGQPFPVSNADPLDEELNAALAMDLNPEPWRWRVNARGCLVATDAAVDRRPASALPWAPADEAPGWWDRMLAAHFPDAEVFTASTWADVTSTLLEGGPGTRTAVWLRRQLSGAELTGHLLYGFQDEKQAVFLDGQRGSLARLDDDEIGQLVVARFFRPVVTESANFTVPWEAPAPNLQAALDKATSWLEHTYPEPVVVLGPGDEDETERGWLFACTTQRFLDTGEWQDQMLDAALVVPKEAGQAPFGLPNNDPWSYMSGWDAGRDGIGRPPAPGAAAWYAPTMRELGTPLSSTEHRSWGEALTEMADTPQDSRALVWIRRQDARGRETVGNLLVAVNEGGEIRLVDSMAEDGLPTFDQEPLAVHVIRYR
ncbi:Papain fold toxin 1, glutamine deamidase [Saccharopolyspora shandongensis]|uniref:Papain fold toxin 1, glutamine deamidase n=1 Tax=Saccharopolyspora shandongensis TaxID=418495 RepID=A0A1H3IMG4_9PSEU|nr:YrhB domain-containing protein [Saccharopolyspora shandongensis]SDY28976.1 Papain fold toxin 1, glutamine deamidase [Saccharopolyspora shandongensis]